MPLRFHPQLPSLPRPCCRGPAGPRESDSLCPVVDALPSLRGLQTGLCSGPHAAGVAEPGVASGTGPTGLSDGGAGLWALLPYLAQPRKAPALKDTPWELREPEGRPEAPTSSPLDRWGGAGAHLPEAPAALPTADGPCGMCGPLLSWAPC